VSDDARLRDRRTTAVETGATPQGSAADVSGVTSEALKTLIMGLPEDQIPGLDVSRERKAHYDAEVARLEALKERQELVLVQEVRQEASRLAKQVRDLLLMIPARNAAKVAAMQDQEKVRALLQSEIETALRGLANA
jgi:phage terminase Nu1 subunit (DNA packaging protein)